MLDAAEAIITEKGFEGATVAEIVRRAETSVGAFYNRFGEKEALLSCLHERFTNEAIATTDAVLDPERWEDSSIAEILSETIPFLVEVYREKTGLIRAFIARGCTDDEFCKRWVPLNEHLVSRLRELILARREDITHPEPSLAIRVGLQMVLSTLDRLSLFRVSETEILELSDARLSGELVRQSLRGTAMRNVFFTLLALAVALPVAAAEIDPADSIGQQIDGFTLQDFRGREHTLDEYADSPCIVVAFMGIECPLAKLYGSRLQELADEFADKNVVFLGVDSNRQDSITELAHFARTYGVEFPLLKDTGNVVADQFDAERTPEVFLLDQDRVIRYRGRVDDQYGLGSSTGYAKTDVRRRFLAEAIEAVLAGDTVEPTTTEAP
ncbi:Thioredoxin-like protein YneN, partial [Durusdinium trenchii]